MKKSRYYVFLLMLVVACYNAQAQDILEPGRLSGNISIEGQSYKEDATIEAEKVNEQFLGQGFFNLNYSNSVLDLGLRYEGYFNPLKSIDPQYKGKGVPHLFGTYTNDLASVTVGSFYEQFGSGMIFRAYEEKALGIDNAINGLRVKINTDIGISITGLAGVQRDYWEVGKGLVRGLDVNIAVTDILDNTFPEDWNINFGTSFISKYQADENTKLNLPENVMAASSRLGLTMDGFSFDAEYAYKYNDPNATNNNTFNPGKGLLLSSSIYGDGIGFSLDFHHVDNMDFRSDRAATKSRLTLNYIPAITKQQAYRLATFNTYSTILNGEAGMQAEFTYKFKRKSPLGGKYGTTVSANYSRVQEIYTQKTGEFRYDADFLAIGKELYFQDINLEVSKKLSKTIKMQFTYINQTYNKDIVEKSGVPTFGKVFSNILVADLTWKVAKKHSLRFEGQHMFSTQDSTLKVPDNNNGNWALALVEYTFSPHWYFTVFDEWNYGNKFDEKQLHYLNVSAAYIRSTTRLALAWGRQKAGILCVGGVCRQVPAANGFYLSLTTSF